MNRLDFLQNKQFAGDDLVFAVVEQIFCIDIFKRSLRKAELFKFFDQWQMSKIAIAVVPGGHGDAERGAWLNLAADVFEKCRDDVVAVAADLREFSG